MRSTKWPVNSNLVPISSGENNEVPFTSGHAGGANFVFADGHVDFVKDTIDMATYQALSTINGGEAISSDDY
jgi:prepilin-type processing-associated H-X9-DG protein